MNNDFQSYLNKKKDLFEVSCSCKAQYFVFVDLQNCYSVCKKCGKKNYELNCEFCQAVLKFNQDDNSINQKNNTWQCVECHKINQGLPNIQINGYKKGELPTEIWKEDDSRRLVPKWSFWVFVVGIAIYYLWRMLYSF